MIYVEIGGQTVEVAVDSVEIEMQIEERTTSTMVVIDRQHEYSFEKGMPVTIYSENRRLFSGVVEEVERRYLPPSMGGVTFYTVSCVDWHYAADKRLAAVAYQDMTAGDIVYDLWESYLEPEGIVLVFVDELSAMLEMSTEITAALSLVYERKGTLVMVTELAADAIVIGINTWYYVGEQNTWNDLGAENTWNDLIE